MRRILEPGQIESLASRQVPRIRLPAATTVFAARAVRFESLAAGHSLGGYLRLMAQLAHAQASQAGGLACPLPDPATLAAARDHGMPLLPARGMQRSPAWRDVLRAIVAPYGAGSGAVAPVIDACGRLAAAGDAQLEALAERLLAADGSDADPGVAPFVMAALQVYWTALAGRLSAPDIPAPEAAGSCPTCGLAPVASVVRCSGPFAGYRYLHCGLCATEWHRVRVECTACGAAKGVAYQSIEGGAAAVRAETCDECRAYRKIFYEEHDAALEPLADDLASVALDLLLAAAGYHRASGNPLLWHAGP